MSFINRIMPRWRALALPERSKWLLGLDTTQGDAQDCISILWHIMVPVESHETHCDANHRSKQIDVEKNAGFENEFLWDRCFSHMHLVRPKQTDV